MMTPDQYRALLAAGRCPTCRTTRRTHGSGGGQRQCPECRRKWSFARLRAEMDLLAAFAHATPARTAAERLGISQARVLRHYARFRAAIPAAHADRVRQALISPAGLFPSEAARRVEAVLDCPPERVDGAGSGRLTASVVGQAVVFLAAEEVDRFTADVAELGGRVAAVVPVVAVMGAGRTDPLPPPMAAIVSTVRRRRRVPVLGVPGHLCEVAEREWTEPAGIERLVLRQVILPSVRRRTGRPTNGE